MKINLIIIRLLLIHSLALCFVATAQSGPSASISTNTYSLGQNDIWDETWQEEGYWTRSLIHHFVMPETLPTDQDTNGNWGLATNGLQLSLRFRRQEYVIGEVIPAISILRNLESQPQTLLLTNSQSMFLTFLIQRDTNATYLPEVIKPIPQPTDIYMPISGPPSGLDAWKWEARSEKEIVLKLNRIFDLNQTGEYTVRVICRIYSPDTRLPLYEVSSGTTSFRIVPKPAPAGQNTSTNSPP